MLQEGRAAVEVHAEAQVKPIVSVGSGTTMRVVLTAAPAAAQGEMTDAATSPASGAEPAARHLWVTVEPRGLKLALGVRRARALRLGPGGSAAATFRLVGVEPGPGEVTVVICGEGRDPLARLQATIEVVGSGDHDQTGVARVTTIVPSGPAGAGPECPPIEALATAEPGSDGEITTAGSGSTA